MWSWRWNSGTRRATRSDLGIPQTKTADVNDRTGTQPQLGPGRASRETDLAVALLGFAFCRARQAALRSTRAILRSQVACGAINGVIAAIGTIIVTSRPEVQLQAHFFGPCAWQWRVGCEEFPVCAEARDRTT